MGKRGTNEARTAYIGLVLVMAVVIAVSLVEVHKKGVISGAITAQGGYVTPLEITATQPASNWASLYGEIVLDASAGSLVEVNLSKGNISELNISLNCLGDELYLSNSTVSDWDALTTGNAGMVNQYLGIDSSSTESATRMFTANLNFQAGSNQITAPSTYTLTQSQNLTTFNLGILNNSGNFVLVSGIVSDKVGFDGQTHDYQLMVPAKPQITSYYLFSDCVTEEEEEEEETPSGGGGGGEIIKVPIEILPVEEKLGEITPEKKPEEIKEKQEKENVSGAEIIKGAKNVSLAQPGEGQPTALAGKAWGAGVTEKFALYFFPLALMAIVMLISIIWLFWIKKRRRERNDFKPQHNSKGKR
ncbi:hypothetical protein HZC30_03910 [Candidatus Woesearchaeota archaeon]|nr:hypothetical protein [Candidatus Woesearchaeota archaeon]